MPLDKTSPLVPTSGSPILSLHASFTEFHRLGMVNATASQGNPKLPFKCSSVHPNAYCGHTDAKDPEQYHMDFQSAVAGKKITCGAGAQSTLCCQNQHPATMPKSDLSDCVTGLHL
ncbi:hypothetical protein PCANC_13687 [Puccinia coronata f. sp. avenae]|uniref:Uncharacterized protein n=1 Tax=Puccinia coronata f. sp. avenae TaxID=200324 RepID=A0A2N5SQ07_9BASI|nr:hypothetical protein PCANC_13687 [Puccinia coronata f. sp. avenae]